jgi:cell division protein FtsB
MKGALKLITNKFLLTGLAFLVWMVFFDQNNWSSQQERKKDLRETERNIAYLNSEIARMENEYRELTTNPQRLEQYARERYKMKRDNEDVYVIEH